MITAKKTLVERYRHIYSEDPALDTSVEDFTDRFRVYMETGDESKLPLREGEKPTHWILRQLRGRARARLQWALEQYTSEQSTIPMPVLLEAARLALVGVEDSVDDEGERLQIQLAMDRDLGWQVLSGASMDQIYETNPRILPELGRRAFQEAFLQAPLSKG